MVGRRRREDRREERDTFGRGGGATRYRMHEKLVSIGDDYWIENENRGDCCPPGLHDYHPLQPIVFSCPLRPPQW